MGEKANIIYISDEQAEDMLRRDVEIQERWIAQLEAEHEGLMREARRELRLRREELAEFLADSPAPGAVGAEQ